MKTYYLSPEGTIAVRNIGPASGDLTLQPRSWQVYRKTALTAALRILGNFAVETSEGLLTCKDGYLAVDARGYPYPIAADEFDLIYEQFREE